MDTVTTVADFEAVPLEGTLFGSLPGELRSIITHFIPAVLINAPISHEEIAELLATQDHLWVMVCDEKDCHTHQIITGSVAYRSPISMSISIDHASGNVVIGPWAQMTIHEPLTWLDDKGYFLDIISFYHVLAARFVKVKGAGVELLRQLVIKMFIETTNYLRTYHPIALEAYLLAGIGASGYLQDDAMCSAAFSAALSASDRWRYRQPSYNNGKITRSPAQITQQCMMHHIDLRRIIVGILDKKPESLKKLEWWRE